MRILSPRRNSTTAENVDDLVTEQLRHHGIDAGTPFGHTLARIARRLYENQDDIEQLWEITLKTVGELDRSDRIAYFNAKKFLTFQLAKSLDTLQNPFRRSYQSLGYSTTSQYAKGPYPVFDNVTAIFSANPVIARTATYIYACAEWIEDAFRGKELLHEIYSRLLNPTSIALANHIVDLEAGPYADQYMAWNFGSGMAAMDSLLAHLLGRDDILIVSRNIYGGVHQLIHDWYGRKANLDIAIEAFEGTTGDAFDAALAKVREKYADRLAAGRRVYLHLESPCNPHGYFLDTPAICRRAHAAGVRVMLDATVGTPFLVRPLRREDPVERPDFVVHSYTKDISGSGAVVAGVVIGRNEDMFLPKGTTTDEGKTWDQTLFWNVYYVKGAFLHADAAFEVLEGMRTLELRMLAKCINTRVLARYFASHPMINVHCSELADDPNCGLRQSLSFLGLPAPLFTVDLEPAELPHEVFQRFFDSLAPTFDHMISLGQSNTIVSCPALTTHSELSSADLEQAGITPTMIRLAVGDESPYDLLAHLLHTARLIIDPVKPGFSHQFMSENEVVRLVEGCYLETHRGYIENQRADIL